MLTSTTQTNPPLEKQCDRCGLTLQELSRTGLVGCEHCYVIFSLEVELALEKVQNRSVVPSRLPWPTKSAIDISTSKIPNAGLR